MKKPAPKKTVDYIVPMLINKMHGRMLKIPAAKKTYQNKEILIIYGHHASLERIFGIADEFSKYGNVTAPDLPGFGGMDSFYKIGRKPTLDALADYVASFIKLRYSRKRLTIVGISFGLVVLTRTLQRYPELAKKVDMVISIVGFAHMDDWLLSQRSQRLLKTSSLVGSSGILSWLLSHTATSAPVLRTVYRRRKDTHPKLKDSRNNTELEKRISYEVMLWKKNHLRTRLYTIGWLLDIDLCNHQVKVPVAHVAVRNDHMFNNAFVEQHLGVIYTKVSMHFVDIESHAPTRVDTTKEAEKLFPKSLRILLK